MGMCCKKNAMIGWRNAQSMKYRPRGPQTERKTRGPGKVVGNDCQARKLNKEDAMDRSIDEVDKGCLMNRKGVSGWMFLLVPAYPGSPEQQSLTTVRHCQSKEASLLWSHHEETRKAVKRSCVLQMISRTILLILSLIQKEWRNTSWRLQLKGLRDSAGFLDSKENNKRVLNKAGVKRELLDTVKARKLAYYGHTMRKQGSCLKR